MRVLMALSIAFVVASPPPSAGAYEFGGRLRSATILMPTSPLMACTVDAGIECNSGGR